MGKHLTFMLISLAVIVTILTITCVIAYMKVFLKPIFAATKEVLKQET